MKTRLILAAVLLLVGAALIAIGILPSAVTTYTPNLQTGIFEPHPFAGGELLLIYTFSKG